MRLILNHRVKQWTKLQKMSVAHSFSEWCPHCSEKVIFTTTSHQMDPHRACVSSSTKCPGCNHHVGVWCFGANGEEYAEVYIHPNTGEPHAPKDVSSIISEPLFRSYTSTIEAYNSGNYVATAVCCRRTLEGLFQELLPEGEKVNNLAKAITKVADTVELSLPIKNLANVLRHGGNLGAHFDMEKEPDDQMALQMLTLLENLIEFLHVLPNEISALEKLLDKET
ncbi:DUF4145 domain-containing protein [Pseudoalteromonas piscicida]|uniref:DUF4145 domain-containing protein n=1 Tax=Pseudoalteromonas piscicida TaxID=43662 RepID=UPI003C7A8726